jgi:hypothetical protein
MKEIYDKLSSYNIFNYLFPGILFVLLSKAFVGYNFILENDFLGAFLYYFIGMVISRFGSIIIEPMLKKISFLKFEPYREFVVACKKDSKIELLSEVNNTYRTLVSMVILLLLMKAYFLLDVKYHFTKDTAYLVIVILLLILFLFSYRKQTNYISKRIKANN